MCFEINGLKHLKLTILRFLPRPSTYLYYSNSSKKQFVLLKHYLLCINSHEFTYTFYTYILKCIFGGSNYFGVYGCWLVWLLLYFFMVAEWFFVINSASDFDSTSESDDSESDFSSVVMNLDICVFSPYIYTLLNKLWMIFLSILITESIVMQAMQL